MQSKDLYPYMHSVEAVWRRGAQLPLALFEKDQLQAALLSAQEWKRGAAEMFLKRSWPFSLLEALSPRTEGGALPRRRARPAGEPPPSSLEAGLFLRNFSEDASPTEIVAAFKQAEARELLAVKELRARNLRKEVRAPAPAPPSLSFCVCQKRQYGVMTQCELCKDWFHGTALLSTHFIYFIDLRLHRCNSANTTWRAIALTRILHRSASRANIQKIKKHPKR